MTQNEQLIEMMREGWVSPLEVRASEYKNSFDDAEISSLKFALRYITEARGYTYEKKGKL